ncbi:hypothetical protein A1OE_512 [Candidatus Endolissoclinum faulkneri L2]|uniref:Uncharacterized protein n=1 Tax=Candidatus Endolissoclinum faulkneri L2 TaxID=1193729 RepID=K7YGH8_9PROT|nr:hypothetical protein A1OE_512 [Candidatus Endolissoclinum faulkneri L2]
MTILYLLYLRKYLINTRIKKTILIILCVYRRKRFYVIIDDIYNKFCF